MIFAKVIFTQLTLPTLGISAMECSSFRGMITSRWRNSRLALELVVCFVFVFVSEHTDKPYFPFVDILSGWYYVRTKGWRQVVPSPWPLDF